MFKINEEIRAVSSSGGEGPHGGPVCSVISDHLRRGPQYLPRGPSPPEPPRPAVAAMARRRRSRIMRHGPFRPRRGRRAAMASLYEIGCPEDRVSAVFLHVYGDRVTVAGHRTHEQHAFTPARRPRPPQQAQQAEPGHGSWSDTAHRLAMRRQRADRKRNRQAGSAASAHLPAAPTRGRSPARPPSDRALHRRG